MLQKRQEGTSWLCALVIAWVLSMESPCAAPDVKARAQELFDRNQEKRRQLDEVRVTSVIVYACVCGCGCGCVWLCGAVWLCVAVWLSVCG